MCNYKLRTFGLQLKGLLNPVRAVNCPSPPLDLRLEEGSILTHQKEKHKVYVGTNKFQSTQNYSRARS